MSTDKDEEMKILEEMKYVKEVMNMLADVKEKLSLSDSQYIQNGFARLAIENILSCASNLTTELNSLRIKLAKARGE